MRLSLCSWGRVADYSGYRTTSKFAVHVLSADDQLYHYEESALFPRLKSVQVPRDALGPKDVSVRADLESIGIAICSTEVRYHFSTRALC